jgi:hypothetical protein
MTMTAPLLRIAFTLGLFLVSIQGTAAQQAPTGVSNAENAACRSDAIRLCFFSLASADGLRTCLRGKKPSLSVPCRKLIESRGN